MSVATKNNRYKWTEYIKDDYFHLTSSFSLGRNNDVFLRCHVCQSLCRTHGIITDDFIRSECGTHGAQVSEQDCARIREEIMFLHQHDRFYHTGVYWVANRLAAEGKIHPILP